MRQQLIASIVLVVLTGSVLLVQAVFFHTPTREQAFCIHLIVWISGPMSIIFGLNALWQAHRRRSESTASDSVYFAWPNRRQCYRLVYPESLRPMLIIERSGSQQIRQLEYPVVDISEGGLCFLDDGTLGSIVEFSGRLRFKQGNAMRISGLIVRREDHRVSIQLHHDLAWQTILNEQRNLISRLK